VVVISLTFKYLLLIFVGIVGVLQAAASYNNLQGMMFFRNRIIGYVVAVLAIGVSIVSFFIWNYILPTGIIGGSEQSGLFALATVAGIIVTLLVSSLLKSGQLKSEDPHPRGLDALKTATMFQCLRDIFRGKG
jgi:hypothetical protein